MSPTAPVCPLPGACFPLITMTVLERDIVNALAVLRAARSAGQQARAHAAEQRLNALLDRLGDKVDAA